MKRLDRVKSGFEAGILGGAAVALLFFVLDLLAIHPFATPDALAARWFGPGGYEIDVSVVARVGAFVGSAFQILVYTLFHFLAFALLGVVASVGLRWGTTWPGSLLRGLVFGVTVCSLVFYGGSFLFGAPVVGAGPGLEIVLVANAVAGLVIGGVLHWAHLYHEAAPTPE